MNILNKIKGWFGFNNRKDVFDLIGKIEIREEKKTSFNFFDTIKEKIRIFTNSLKSKIYKDTPSSEELINYANDIIRYYETAPDFNKLELLRLIGEKYKNLNKYYFIYHNNSEHLTSFLEKKYKAFSDFFMEDDIQKEKNLIWYYQYYFKRRTLFKKYFAPLILELLFLLIAIGTLIIGVVYVDFYFFTSGRNILEWEFYYSQMSPIRQMLFDNTYGIMLFFSNSSTQGSVGMSASEINNQFILNSLTYIGIILSIILFGYIIYYVISEYNLVNLTKYRNEKNFILWFGIKLEREKSIQYVNRNIEGKRKKVPKTVYRSNDLSDIFTENIIRINRYNLVNSKTNKLLNKFLNINMQGFGKSYEDSKKGLFYMFSDKNFFSDFFTIFWTRLFDIYNSHLTGYSSFNLAYMHDKINERIKIFDEIWEKEISKLRDIIGMILIFSTMGIIMFTSIYNLYQIQNIGNTVETYMINKQRGGSGGGYGGAGGI